MHVKVALASRCGAPVQYVSLSQSSSLQVVYKDIACGGAPEAVGRWANGNVVFVPALSEADFHAALATYASKR